MDIKIVQPALEGLREAERAVRESLQGGGIGVREALDKAYCVFGLWEVVYNSAGDLAPTLQWYGKVRRTARRIFGQLELRPEKVLRGSVRQWCNRCRRLADQVDRLVAEHGANNIAALTSKDLTRISKVALRALRDLERKACAPRDHRRRPLATDSAYEALEAAMDAAIALAPEGAADALWELGWELIDLLELFAGSEEEWCDQVRLSVNAAKVAVEAYVAPADMQSSSWFEQNYGIPGSRLREAARRGALATGGSRQKRTYSVSGVRRRWPEDMIDAAGHDMVGDFGGRSAMLRHEDRKGLDSGRLRPQDSGHDEAALSSRVGAPFPVAPRAIGPSGKGRPDPARSAPANRRDPIRSGGN
jgi:hypothetical protein